MRTSQLRFELERELSNKVIYDIKYDIRILETWIY